jgi:hypothetical protein
LERHITFLSQNEIEAMAFPSLLVALVSSRPTEFLEAFSNYPVICAVASTAVHTEFSRCCDAPNDRTLVGLTMSMSAESSCKDVTIDIPVIMAVAVVLSVWRKDVEYDENATKSADFLCDALFLSESALDGKVTGLASAKLPGNKTVPVEPVSFSQILIHI